MLNFLYGPLLYIAVAVFVIGMIARVVLYIKGLSQKLDRVAYKPQMGLGLQGAFHSIFKWLLPGGTRAWRINPFMTAVFFMFHIGMVLLPLFLLQHVVVIEYMFGISLPGLPSGLADVLSIVAVLGLLGLAYRRIACPVAKALTTKQDWFVLILAGLPLVTGIMFRFSVSSYEFWEFAHILTAEIFLIAAPFTKLSHIVLFFMSRAQIGMDFAIKRGGHNRGPAFPW